MEYKTIISSIVGIFLLIITGITACSDNSLSENGNPINIKGQAAGPLTQIRKSGASMQIILGPTSAHVATDGAHSLQTGGTDNQQLTVSSGVTQPAPQTTVITTSALGQYSQPQEYTVDMDNASARNLVTKVIYSGGNSIDYTVRDQQKTASLNQQQQQLLSDAQQQYTTAQTAYNDVPAEESNPTNPLQNKSEGQIKQMLQAKGYTVTKLGNKRFKLTKTDDDFKRSQVFDAQDFSISNYDIHYQGNEGYSRYFKDGHIQTNQKIEDNN